MQTEPHSDICTEPVIVLVDGKNAKSVNDQHSTKMNCATPFQSAEA